MSPTRLSRFEAGVRLVLDFYEAFNRHDVTAMMQCMSEDCLLETPTPPPDGTTYLGKEAVARYWQGFFHRYPQAHMEIEEVFGLGFRCIARWKCEWKDATGNKVHLRGVDLFKLKGDLICEQLCYTKG